MKRDLLQLNGMPKEEIDFILESTDAFKEILSRPIKKVPTLRGKTIVTLFYEASTRTRMSFELAGKRMGADISNITVSTSSVKKGESFKHTLKTIEAMDVDMVIIRHSQAGAPHLASKYIKSSIINAGDGFHEHPTQGLLDLYTIKRHKKNLEGINVAIVGDIAHSRVARSDIIGLKTMGANVTVVAPPTLLPFGIDIMGVDIKYCIDDVIEWADVLYILRVQFERQASALIPSVREYQSYYQLNSDRLKRAKKDVLVLHPGPMNVGLEITDEVATSVNAHIEEQVHNGVAVRMALLYYLLGGIN